MAAEDPWWAQWDPDQVTIKPVGWEDEDSDSDDDDDGPDDAWKLCVIQGVYYGKNEYNGYLGGRISAIFVIMITSMLATMFPLIAKRFKRLRIPELVFMIARMFGSGVIVCTAFIHLMDPAYGAIGGWACVAQTGHWADYGAWCPAIMLASAVFTFIVDAYCDFFADVWYGVHDHMGAEQRQILSHAQDALNSEETGSDLEKNDEKKLSVPSDDDSEIVKMDYYSQFAGFLTLEFGILFHSVMIGLDLGSSDEYSTLYIVLVFHQAFEGLGIGARLVNIPFPKDRAWVPWFCCVAYGLTTPIAIAAGVGVRQSYRGEGYTALIVQGVLDAISAGILLYTGFVELLARDFIFNPRRTKKFWYLSLQLFVFLWGAGLMALLGKWA